ncbi:expressed unknown protein [Seminavis robusta]|uniref:Uncharacterized protein n=1 Tax=Seminavis robusta TaxID=568900 RepID=A0A9N8DU89_9STRA|nr:expressed unknown protein [Seminavis robusta]|eukprot:Sro360_g126280.1 n/a (284) ;mRNA; r:46970-47821
MMWIKMFRFASIVSLLMGRAVVAQTNMAKTANKDAEQDKLNTARGRWNARLDNLYYDYVWNQECNICSSIGDYPWRVQVDLSTPMGVNSKDTVPTDIRTVEYMFDDIQNAIFDSTWYTYGEYDGTYGYPYMYQIQQGEAESNLYTNRVTSFQTEPYDRSGMYQTNRNLWNAQRNGGNLYYEFTYTDYEDLQRGIAWPLKVTVSNGYVVSTLDNAQFPVTILTPNTIDQLFDQIGRNLDMQAPLVLNTYDPSVGYPSYMDMVSTAGVGMPGVATKMEIHSYTPL